MFLNHKHKHQIKTMADFPEDLVVEIFTKLPVKSLVRFKSACTYWTALFGTRSFISLHTKNSKNNILVKTLESDCFNMISCSKEDSDDFASHNLMSRVGMGSDFESRLTIVDLCNGLVCLTMVADPQVIYIRNLATRESRFVPRLECDYGGSMQGQQNLRFVFNPTNDDYNVVRVVSVLHPNKLTSTVLVELYSLKANCWGQLDDVNVPETMRSNPHWLEEFEASTSGVPCWWFFDKGVIVTFDVSTQSLHETSLPDHLHRERGRMKMKMTTLNGSMALVTIRLSQSSGHDHHVCDIWVLGEIGVKESWSKRFSIRPFHGDFVPIGFWDDSGLVFKSRVSHPMGLFQAKYGSEGKIDKLFMYVFQEERMKDIEIAGGLYPNYRAAPIQLESGDDVQVVNYVETLVSPKMSLKRKRPYISKRASYI